MGCNQSGEFVNNIKIVFMVHTFDGVNGSLFFVRLAFLLLLDNTTRCCTQCVFTSSEQRFMKIMNNCALNTFQTRFANGFRITRLRIR